MILLGERFLKFLTTSFFLVELSLLLVQYGDFCSHELADASEMPQGSNLGPLLFLIFINDITESDTVPKLISAGDLKNQVMSYNTKTSPLIVLFEVSFQFHGYINKSNVLTRSRILIDIQLILAIFIVSI